MANSDSIGRPLQSSTIAPTDMQRHLLSAAVLRLRVEIYSPLIHIAAEVCIFFDSYVMCRRPESLLSWHPSIHRRSGVPCLLSSCKAFRHLGVLTFAL